MKKIMPVCAKQMSTLCLFRDSEVKLVSVQMSWTPAVYHPNKPRLTTLRAASFSLLSRSLGNAEAHRAAAPVVS